MTKLSYTYAEAAESVGTSETAIKDAVRNNEMVAYRLSPRRPVITAGELLRWIESKPTEAGR